MGMLKPIYKFKINPSYAFSIFCILEASTSAISQFIVIS